MQKGSTDIDLEELAKAPSASTLTRLIAQGARFTNKTSDIWAKFTNLTDLALYELSATAPAIDAMLRLPRLRSINLSLESGESTTGILLKALSRLQFAESISISSSSFLYELFETSELPSQDVLIDSLQQNASLCSSLRDIHWSTASLDDYVTITHHCPNLTSIGCPLTFPQLRRLAPSLGRLRSVSICEGKIEQGDVEWLANSFPKLENLSLRSSVSMTATSLIPIRFLSTLSYRGASFSAYQFPPSLESLYVYLTEPDCQGEFSKLIQTLEQGGLPSLNDLSIAHDQLALKQVQMEAILATYPQLTRFVFYLTEADIPQDNCITISHPRLRTVLANRGIVCVLPGSGSIPNLEPTGPLNRNLMNAFGTRSFPKISAAILEPDVSYDPDWLLGAMPSLTSVNLSRPTVQSLAAILRLTNLTSIAIRSSKIDESALESLLAALPCLTRLSLTQHCILTHLRWLQSPSLVHLEYATMTKAVSQDALEFEVEHIPGRAMLPCLMTLEFHLHHKFTNKWSFLLRNLPNLESFRVECTNTPAGDLALEVAFCSELRNITADSCRFSRMKLDALPRLSSLSLQRSQFSPEFTLINPAGEGRTREKLPSLTLVALTIAGADTVDAQQARMQLDSLWCQPEGHPACDLAQESFLPTLFC